MNRILTDSRNRVRGGAAKLKDFATRLWRVGRSISSTMILFSLLLVSGTVVAVILYYRDQEARIILARDSELTSVAELKVRQIVRWRIEREGDGMMIAHNVAYARQAEAYFKHECPENELLRWIEVMCVHDGYLGAGLFDTLGNLRLSYDGMRKNIGNEDRALMRESRIRKKVILSDLHREENTDDPVADLVIPIMEINSENSTVVAVYLFRIDLQTFLFPLIQSWPTESRSSESLLIRREGNDVLYLNELRYVRNSALRLRRPVAAGNLPAAMAVSGFEGNTEGTDYRGVRVLASIKRIPNSPWFLIAKVDREEVDETLHQQAWMDCVVGSLLILAMMATVGFWWRHQRVRFFQSQLAAERERRALVQHFEYLVRFANDMIILADKELNIVEVNEKALESYGYQRAELIGSNVVRLESDESAEHFAEQLRLLNLYRGATYESIHRRKDGTTFPVEVSARVIVIEGTVFYQTISRDTTERKKSEAALREREFWIKESQRVGHIGSYALDFVKGKWTSSEVLDEIFGIDGKHDRTVDGWLSLVHPEQKEEMLQYFSNDVIAAAKPFDKEYRIVRQNDSVERWVWGRGELGFDTSGILISMVGTIQDITERKQADNEIRRLNTELEQRVQQRTAQLEAVNRELEAFSYSVSHDLRTPLRGIDGWSLALAEDFQSSLNEKANEYIGRIRNEAQRMGALIDDLLQLSRVARAEIVFKPVDLSALVRSVSVRIQELYPGRHIQFIIEDGLTVEGDSQLLDIALTNLLDNSSKFTAPRVDARVEFGKNNMDGKNVYFVRDNGVGFDMTYAEKMFGAFQRMHKTSEFPGTGVGLATVQRIIRRHSGKVWANAAVGHGATFFFTLWEAQ